MKNKETWKIINEYSDYLISDFGKIKSLKEENYQIDTSKKLANT